MFSSFLKKLMMPEKRSLTTCMMPPVLWGATGTVIAVGWPGTIGATGACGAPYGWYGAAGMPTGRETFIIGGDVQAGRLTAVLSDYVPSERHIHAVYLPNRHLPAKVRAFIDFLVERFSPRPYWDVE